MGVRGGALPPRRHSRDRRLLLEGLKDGGAAARASPPVDPLRVGVDLLRLAPESLGVVGDLGRLSLRGLLGNPPSPGSIGPGSNLPYPPV